MPTFAYTSSVCAGDASVFVLQQMLKEVGITPFLADGLLDQHERRADKAFQLQLFCQSLILYLCHYAAPGQNMS